MKKIFYTTGIATIALIIIGMFSFSNFRDFLYLLVILLGFISIFVALGGILNKIDK